MRLTLSPSCAGRVCSIIFCLIGLLWKVDSAAKGKAKAPAPEFATPAATAAKTKFEQAMLANREQCARDLEAAMKISLQAGKLDEANAINEVSKKIVAGTAVSAQFQSPAANTAMTRYTQALSLAKQQYYWDLEDPLKVAMAAGDLQEANAINAARRVVEGSRPPATPVAAATPQSSGVAFAPTVVSLYRPGLKVKEYARQPSQVKENNFCLPVENLGEPSLKAFTIKSLLGWKYTPAHNAIAMGYLVVEQDGAYSFNTSSTWDRNSLVVNGTILCKAPNGQRTDGIIQLKKGIVPIISAGMVENNGVVTVKWKPPGQKELSEIPANLLKHD